MKKYQCLLASLAIVFFLSGCNTLGKKKEETPSSLPTLEPCSENLLNANQSFICIKEQKGTDLIETNIKFGTNSFTLNQQAKEVLDKLYAYLKITGNSGFTIRGYSGKIDSKLIQDPELLVDHDIRLSKNRAISVRDYFADEGLDAENISIKALGYQDPIAPNDSNAHRALNQRVEITVKNRLLEQIDNIESHLKHVKPANYAKFFSNVFLLNTEQVDDIAQIYDSQEKKPTLSVNFKIFANKQYPIKGDGEQSFNIISKPKPLESFNSDTKVYKIGTAKYDYTFKGITALTITNLSREANVGDFVVPNDLVSKPLPENSFRMTSKITANVLEDVMNTNTFSASYNSVLLNKGASSGLKLGAEVIIYEPESRTDGFPIPPKYAGYGFVYRQSDNYSVALIINSVREISKNSMATTIL
jgi:outer membrane protein OmpA-like peptidoglycan-associated protein